MANVERLKQIRNTILNFEENFDYSTMLSFKDDVVNEECTWHYDYPEDREASTLLKHNCNTCGCVAGFVIALEYDNYDKRDIDRYDYATEWLGLTQLEAEWLFQAETFDNYKDLVDRYEKYYDHDWTDEDKYDALASVATYVPLPDFIAWDVCSHDEGLEEAIRRIDHLIAYYEIKNQPQ
jgi:enolase